MRHFEVAREVFENRRPLWIDVVPRKETLINLRPRLGFEIRGPDVEDAIERLRFNVGIARLMAYLPSVVSSQARSVYARLLAPFAPHLAEELWASQGQPFSVHTASWPEYDVALLSSREVEWVVQVNGKVRDRVHLSADADEETVVRLARQSASVAAALDGHGLERVVFVPGRLVNLVAPPQ